MHPYDRNPHGYLTRDREPTRPRESHTATISLGLDPVKPDNHNSLHMVSQKQYDKSRYEDRNSNSSREIPIIHYQYGTTDTRAPSRRLSYGSGGGGLKQCTYCQSLTSNAQRVCVNCRTRMVHPTTHFAAMRQAQLVKCKRIGCPNGASSNVGLCRDCETKERLLQSTKNSRGSANLKYSYY